LHSTATDLMKFLNWNLSMNKNYFTNLLDYTHNPRLKPDMNSEKEIAMGWQISPLKESDGNVVSQTGLTSGFSTYIGFVETSHTGVFILCSGHAEIENSGKQILELLQKIKLVDVYLK
jgi:hypothetical protein